MLRNTIMWAVIALTVVAASTTARADYADAVIKKMPISQDTTRGFE